MKMTLAAIAAILAFPALARAQFTWSGPVNLQATPLGPENSSHVLLEWQEGGAMGQQGYDKYDSYGVYYSPADPGYYPDDSWFAAAVRVDGAPSVAEPEQALSMQVGGLAASTLYYFAVRGEYADPQYGTTSPTTTSLTTPPDGGAPASVTLHVAAATSSGVTLTWTAPGDDGMGPSSSSLADHYILRKSTKSPGEFADAAAWFAQAQDVYGLSAPLPTGSPEQCKVTSLSPGTHWGFAISAVDELGKQGPVLTVTAAATTGQAPSASSGPEHKSCLGSASGIGCASVLLLALAFRRRP